MRIIIAAAVGISLVSAPIWAAKPAAKKPTKRSQPKSITLKSLVNMTVKKGTDWVLDDPRAGNLGYSQPPKVKEYLINEASTDAQFSSFVTLGDDGKTPGDIMISSTTVTEFQNGQPAAIDGYTFRFDLTGKPVAVVRAYGKVGDIVQERLDISDPKIKTHSEAALKAARVQAATPQPRP